MWIAPFAPVAFHLGPVAVHWYGLAYAATFLVLLFGGRYQLRAMPDAKRPCSESQFESLLSYAMLGVLIGGRLGYMLFYHTAHFLTEPWSMFYIWQGGMSFHGGLLGCVVALWGYAVYHHLSLLKITDAWALWAPLGLGLGRAANFVNGELWGRPTDQSWGVLFPWVDQQLRHPSQLYEMVLEGVVLGGILFVCLRKTKPIGWLSGCFLFCYGLIRFAVEYFREPDAQLGQVLWGALSMGQCLSVPMMLLGGYWILRWRRKA